MDLRHPASVPLARSLAVEGTVGIVFPQRAARFRITARGNGSASAVAYVARSDRGGRNL